MKNIHIIFKHPLNSSWFKYVPICVCNAFSCCYFRIPEWSPNVLSLLLFALECNLF